MKPTFCPCQMMQRRQLLEGDWNIADGAAFPEFRNTVHTMEPFEPPQTGADLEVVIMDIQAIRQFIGLQSTLLFETLYVYRELYLSKHTGRDLAKAVLDAEAGDKIAYGVLDSSCWHNRANWTVYRRRNDC